MIKTIRQPAFCVFLLTCTVSSLSALAQGEGEGPPPSTPPDHARANQQLNGLGVEIQKLGDWSIQADMIDSFMDKVWDRNGWNTEADVFARRLTNEVAHIPPWQFQKRMEKLTELIADRYTFSPSQKNRFRSRVYRETIGMIAGNADMISSQVREYVSARLDKKPLTPDQIARWTKESEPLVADMLGRADRIIESMKRDMTDEQKRILDRDYQSFDQRTNYFVKQRAAWAKGLWIPEDWGLEHDPIQTGQSPDKAENRTQAAAMSDPFGNPLVMEAPPPHPESATIHHAEDETTWARYVREFIATHNLDAGQRTAIQSILSEMEFRAEHYRKQHRKDLETVPPTRRLTSPLHQPIRQMFQELQARSEALLTKEQQAIAKQ